MTKILAQAGLSLSDVYDIEGSIVGVDQLNAREVHLVHEMGGTLFSERLSGTIRRATTSIAQSIQFNSVLTDLPAGPVRVLAVEVHTSDASRINNVAVVMRDPTAGAAQDIPIWVWDEANSVTTDFDDADAGVAAHTTLVPGVVTQLPNIVMGGGPTSDGARDGTARPDHCLRGRHRDGRHAGLHRLYTLRRNQLVWVAAAELVSRCPNVSAFWNPIRATWLTGGA